MKKIIFLLAMFFTISAFAQSGSVSNPQLPKQTGHANKFLKTDGVKAFWATPAGGGTLAIAAISPLFETSGTFSIQPATTSQNGYLSSVDWNTFNNKLPSTTSLIINGTTKTFTSTPSFSVTYLTADNQVNTNIEANASLNILNHNIENRLSAPTNRVYGDFMVLHTNGSLYNLTNAIGFEFNNGAIGAEISSNAANNIFTHSIQNTFDAPNNFPLLAATTIPYLNASKNLVSSTVTPTELNLLGGVTGSLTTTTGTQTLTNKYISSGTANTPTVGSNNSSIATTSFVAQALAASSASVIILTADVTTTVTTATTIGNFTLTVDSNSTYIIRGKINVGCNNTGGVKLGATYPANTVCSLSMIGRAATNTAVIAVATSNSGTLVTGFNTVNSTGGYAVIEGSLTTTNTNGTFTFIIGSQTSGQLSTAYGSSSYLEIIKVR